MIKKLKYKFKYEIRYWPKDFIIGIKNLIRWFPIVWKDRQWDHQYIYSVLKFKLHLMEQFIRHNGIHVNHVQDADKIKKCVLVLERIMKDEYHENVFKYHDKKWGETKLNWKEVDGKEFGYKKDVVALDITRENAISKDQKEKERKEFRRLSPKVEQQRKQDIDFLFDYMKKHIQGWWD